MKTLTQKQMKTLGVYNPWEFCRTSFFLSYTPHSNLNRGSFGWHLVVPSKPKPGVHPSYREFDWPRVPGMIWLNGKSTPEDMKPNLEPMLNHLGLKWPERWVWFWGAWMDGDYRDRRMAELVARYKAAQACQKS